MNDMSEASYVIGVKIFQDGSQRLLGLSQKAYINKVLKEICNGKCSAIHVPIQKGDKFSTMQCPNNYLERKQMEEIAYASVVGSLICAQTCTRPNTSFVVGLLGRYQSNLGLDHWKAAKKVLRYSQGMKDHMLTFQSFDLEVIAYSNSNFVSCADTRKSIFVYLYLLASHIMEEYEASSHCFIHNGS